MEQNNKNSMREAFAPTPLGNIITGLVLFTLWPVLFGLVDSTAMVAVFPWALAAAPLLLLTSIQAFRVGNVIGAVANGVLSGVTLVQNGIWGIVVICYTSAGRNVPDASGMLFRPPNGMAVESTFLRKRFERWQEEHPGYEKIVFHGLRHSSATYQLEVSGGDIKAVQGNIGHAQAGILVDTYAHIQNRACIDLAARIEQDFYSAEENDTPVHNPTESTEKMSFSDILELIQQADPAQKKQLTLALLA